ncbi:MAG: hypothetical protein QF435_14320, partial [Arenicellales bacterium]|nr:hypothetical protein [Arenicellales bacterium]
FLIVTNNESSDQEVRLTITDSPVPLASLRVREPHANSLLQLNELGAGQYRLDDTLANHDVAIYVFDAKPL